MTRGDRSPQYGSMLFPKKSLNITKVVICCVKTVEQIKQMSKCRALRGEKYQFPYGGIFIWASLKKIRIKPLPKLRIFNILVILIFSRWDFPHNFKQLSWGETTLWKHRISKYCYPTFTATKSLKPLTTFSSLHAITCAIFFSTYFFITEWCFWNDLPKRAANKMELSQHWVTLINVLSLKWLLQFES